MHLPACACVLSLCITRQQRTARPSSGVLPGQPTSINYTLHGEKIYGTRVDNYNKRNGTQWDQSWK